MSVISPYVLFFPINKKKSFYVGDMAGRKKDKSDSDFKFALNIKFKFYTPEEYFKDTFAFVLIPAVPIPIEEKDVVFPIDTNSFLNSLS